MTLRSIADRALQKIVASTLTSDADPEVDRLLVAGAVVARDGDHYRIEYGEESPEDLERAWQRAEGRCDCGGPLSNRGARARCRSCGREFSLA